MNSQTLKKGISMLLDMEMSNYLMNKLSNDIKRKQITLAKPKRINEPREEVFLSCFDSGDWALWFFIGGVIAALIMGLISWLSLKGMLDSSFLSNFRSHHVAITLIIMLLSGAIGYIVYVIVNDIKQLIKIKKQYNDDVYLYKVSLAMDEGRVEDEHVQIQALEKRRDELIIKQRETQRNLTAFYDKMGIDSNFRGLVAMGYMEELIRLGVSDHLEGVDGLYYLVRKDLRQDQMQATLDQISNKLDMILNNQKTLYNAIVSMNNQCTALLNASMAEVKKLNKTADIIAENSRITAYTAERIKKEEEYRNFMLNMNYFNK